METKNNKTALLPIIVSTSFMLLWLSTMRFVDGVPVGSGALGNAICGESPFAGVVGNRTAAMFLGIAVMLFIPTHVRTKWPVIKRLFQHVGARPASLDWRLDGFLLARMSSCLSGILLTFSYLISLLMIAVTSPVEGSQTAMEIIQGRGNGVMMVVLIRCLIAMHILSVTYLMLRYWHRWYSGISRRKVFMVSVPIASAMAFIHHVIVP